MLLKIIKNSLCFSFTSKITLIVKFEFWIALQFLTDYNSIIVQN